MHGKIGGAEPARAVAPRGALGDGADDLEHRNARRIERRRLVGAAAGGKGRHGDDERGFEPLERPVQKRARLTILQAGDEQRGRRQAARGKRRTERIDRCSVVGKQQRAVEDDRHDRMAGFGGRHQPLEIHRAFAREIAGQARHRLRLAQFEVASGMACEPAQQRAQIVAAAFAEETQQCVELLPWQRRGCGKAAIVAILAGQHGERDAAFAGQRGEPLDAVFPPVEAAEQPHHDHLGMRPDTVDPQVDRHRMAQVAQMRQPHARQARALSLPGGGERGEIAVGERQHGDVARRLAEIDRFDDFVEVGRARGQ